ncbi:MAG: mevalonate kinase [Arachnia propionica]|nr:MAG: mevalonate kinase [Arachnia propionica]
MQIRKSGTGDSHAKLILFGEHVVVYGEPAIAVPLPGLTVTATATPTAGPVRLESDLPLTETEIAAPRQAIRAILALLRLPDAGVRVRIASSVPPGRGLGSSAATAGAIVAAIADLYGRNLASDKLYELVQAAERVAHGAPSGLDARATSAAGPIWFQRGRAEAIELASPLHLVVADTGMPGSTRQAVAEVAQLHRDQPNLAKRLTAELGALTETARDALRRGDTALVGRFMSRAQRLLTQLGVSSPKIEHLVASAREHGALGAKLSGGGQGGCIVALAKDAKRGALLRRALLAAGAADAWSVKVGKL